MPFIFSTKKEAESHNKLVMPEIDGVEVRLTADRLFGFEYAVDVWKIVPKSDKPTGSDVVDEIFLKDGCKVLCVRNKYEAGSVRKTDSGYMGTGKFTGYPPAFVKEDGSIGMFLRCSNGTFGTFHAATNSFTHRHCTTGETVDTEVFTFDDDLSLPADAQEINREAFKAMRGGHGVIQPVLDYVAKSNGIWHLTRRPCLIPGYGINVHKTQGMTIEEAALSLGGWNNPGLVYTALSRFTSLQGIKLVRDVPKVISGCAFNDDPNPIIGELFEND
jgi:hypothetical protein